MSLLDLLRSVRALFARRARAALTLLGVVLGAGSIVLLAALVGGGKDALMHANQDALETDLIEVRSDAPPRHQERRVRRELSRADAAELGASRSLSGATVLAEASRSTQAHLGARKKAVTLVSASPDAPELYRLSLARGRFVDEDDLAERRRVCVIGHEVWEELLERRDPAAGVHIQVDGQSWSVVGVLADKAILGSTTSSNIWNRKVMVPETTYDATLSSAHRVDKIFLRRGTAAGIVTPIDTLRAITEAALLRRHFGVHNFEVRAGAGKGQEKLILAVIELLLFATAVISLLVGGINIMNVMLVTVTERTREIGVRRAVGASPRAIVAQFLVEAVTLTSIGGLLGVLGGAACAVLSALVLRRVVGAWTLHVEVWAVALGFGLSVLTGLVFGLYPAWRAAKLDPIAALRSE